MCVIIVKYKGFEMPSREELYSAYVHNHHGCGFVSSNGIYWRGMSFAKFYDKLQGVGKNDACIIHFRLATHGSHKTANCHPFKCGDLYFAHNGILPIRTYDDMTDSETEFRALLAPAAEKYGLNSRTFSLIVDKEIGWSKFAFMQNGEITLFGKWINDNGIMYSNLNHRPRRCYMDNYYTASYDTCEVL